MPKIPPEMKVIIVFFRNHLYNNRYWCMEDFFLMSMEDVIE